MLGLCPHELTVETDNFIDTTSTLISPLSRLMDQVWDPQTKVSTKVREEDFGEGDK